MDPGRRMSKSNVRISFAWNQGQDSYKYKYKDIKINMYHNEAKTEHGRRTYGLPPDVR